VETLKVELGSRSYPILIGEGLLEQPELFQKHLPARQLLIVSNTIVAPLYLARVVESLRPRTPVEVILPDGESHKTLATVSRILDVMVSNRLARDSGVIALGGGVVGDIAGFAAACYQRGVACAQLPTTLLSQVDSSVGGKTGVNHPGGKNLIGAFHQPTLVMADTRTLRTLSVRELRAGLAEVIKYGLICDRTLFGWLEDHMSELLAGDSQALTRAILASCQIKARIVGRDEHEQGERALLNLGHTFGHAIESATGYRQWLHGEAVGAGLLMAAAMSRECGLISPEELEKVRRLIELAGLPAQIDGVSPESALEHMQIDKKVQAGRVRLVLLREIGNAFVTADYPAEALTRTLATYFG
jgi:3-dehydroquinate synthase